MTPELVLVTGGSGFVAGHCIQQLLEAGHSVRTTVRSREREREILGSLRAACVEPGDALGFALADLTSDDGWASAVKGCDRVLHVASPYPAVIPRDENELLLPARDGSLRVLRAARDAGVRRVVLTSSFAAIGYGHTSYNRTFTEEDWTNVDGTGVGAYAKSKTLAEHAAWDFVEREGGPLELTVINPVGVLGPAIGPRLSTSLTLIERLLNRGMPALPHLSFGLVDARDVADLHLRAMTHPAAKGQRFLAVSGAPLWIAEIAHVLRDRLGPAGARVPKRELPDRLVRLVAHADPSLRAMTPELGKVKRASAEKARRVLGWDPRSNEEAIVASAQSLIRLGLVKKAA